MLRLRGDDILLQALRGCDRMTFEAVQQAQIDAISDVLWRDGVFVDADGMEHRIPPTIEHVGPMELALPYQVSNERTLELGCQLGEAVNLMRVALGECHSLAAIYAKAPTAEELYGE